MFSDTGGPAAGGMRLPGETGEAGGALAQMHDAAVAHPAAAIAGAGAAIGSEVSAFAPVRRSALTGMIGTVISLALLVAVGWEIRRLDLNRIEGMIPHRPLFWAVFVAAYLIGPVSEWVIYRRLWALPLAGLAALVRKLVSNELLLGYLGEVQFYAWVRGRLSHVVAPFGAIKDVTILSALTGNIATLVMLVPVWPLIASGRLGAAMPRIVEGLGIVLATSFVILLLRRTLFTLPRRLLWWIAAVHMARIFAVVGFSALLWHLVLPGVAIGLWLVLATVRQLLSRVPLLPNKDVMFAGLAVFLLGRDADIADLMTMMAGLLLTMHVTVGGTLALADLISPRVGNR